MKSLMVAAAAVCCVVAAAAAQDVSRCKGEQLAARPQAASARESHPILLLRPDQVELYRPRIFGLPERTKTFGLTTDVVLAALIDYLRGRRCEEAVKYVKDALGSKDPGRIANAVLVYDVQYPFLTPSERTSFREQFLAWVEPIYQDSLNSKHWMFTRRSVNNWTYGYGGMPLQNLLFIGLAFPDHPRSALYVARGKELLTWVLEGGPNNGVWNENRQEFDVYPTKVDLIDESVGGPPVYGLGGLDNLLLIMHVLDNATDYRPFEKFGRMMHSEGRYWTYNLGYKEAIHHRRNNSCLASYMAAVGHGRYDPLSKFWLNNHQFLYLALRYNDPVLAWHHYANPGSIDSPGNRQFIENGLWSVASFADQRVSWDLWTFLSWGKVAPKSPAEAGWPLTEFWPNAGAFFIRKSWTRTARLAKDGEKTGVIWGWAGPGGSKDRVCFGTLRYDADDHEILSCAPFGGSGGASPNLLKGLHPALQNVLIVDGVGQQWFDSIPIQRLRHGVTKRLGPDTFLMDMSPQDTPDFRSQYAHIPVGGVYWTRKVHYDREKDILWIKDVASTGDKKSHRLRFNWISPELEVLNAATVKLSGGYTLVGKSLDLQAALTSELHTHREAYEEFQAMLKKDASLEQYKKDAEGYIWKSVYSGVDAPAAEIVWAIGKDPIALRAYMDEHGKDEQPRAIEAVGREVRADRPVLAGAGLFFREDRRETSPETPIRQAHVANSDLVLTLHGPGRSGIKKSHHTQPADDPYYVWSGTADGNWAISLRHRSGPADLSGAAKIRWRSKQSGFRQLRVILKLADGAWLVSDQSDGELAFSPACPTCKFSQTVLLRQPHGTAVLAQRLFTALLGGHLATISTAIQLR